MKINKRKELFNNIETLIIDSNNTCKKVPAILWIHGGGYFFGSNKLFYFSAMNKVVKNSPVVVFSPNYRLAPKYKYPAALEDCYSVLEYIYDNADKYGVDKDKIMIGGESAGGGLCLATAIYARDKKKIDVKCIFPLYPMIDCDDTESSKNNKGFIWNTKNNHKGWHNYLGDLYKTDNISPYASPAKLNDFSNLPPMYSFVCDGEPFYKETIDFVDKAKKSSVDARVDIYHSNIHSFDMILPFLKISRQARSKFLSNYTDMLEKYVNK